MIFPFDLSRIKLNVRHASDLHTFPVMVCFGKNSKTPSSSFARTSPKVNSYGSCFERLAFLSGPDWLLLRSVEVVTVVVGAGEFVSIRSELLEILPDLSVYESVSESSL